MDQSEHRTRWPQGQRVANGGSVGSSLAPGPTAPTPNRTQVHSRFNSLDLRWQRRVHAQHCYPPRELANGEFEARFCNVGPIWRWPDIGGNALSPGRSQSRFINDWVSFTRSKFVLSLVAISSPTVYIRLYTLQLYIRVIYNWEILDRHSLLDP